jgi:hypothetical protein
LSRPSTPVSGARYKAGHAGEYWRDIAETA